MAYNITKLRTTSTIKKVAFFITIVVCLVIINGLISSIYELWNKQDVVVRARHELNQEKEKNDELKVQLGFVKSNEFVEEEARNKLFLVKPGESDVIISENLIKKKEVKKVVVIPVWQQWLNLFLGE